MQNWLRNNWPGALVGIIILTIVILGISSLRGCAAAATPASSGPSPIFFVIFSIVMILIGARNRDQKYFGAPLLYFGILLFTVAAIGGLGTIKGFFSGLSAYSVLFVFGLTVIAGIVGYNMTGDGFLKKTIGAITAGTALFLVGLVIVRFSGISLSSFTFPTISFPTDWLKNIGDFIFSPMSILVGTTALFAFVWYKSKGKVARFVTGMITLVLVFLVLGQSFFDFGASRWPSQVPTPGSIGQSMGNAGKGIGNLIPWFGSSQTSSNNASNSANWAEFKKIDFGSGELRDIINPEVPIDFPRGSYRFSHTIDISSAKYGPWFVATTLDIKSDKVGKEAIYIRPVRGGGNDHKIVTIFVGE